MKALPYTYSRGRDGTDETWDINGPKGIITSIHFWDAESETKAEARRIVAALNASVGISTPDLEKIAASRKGA